MGKVIKDTLNIAVQTGTSDKDVSKTSNSNTLPSGGTTGQVLTKKSDSDLDTVWQTVSGGAGGGGVETVNSVSPDGLGNVALTQDSIPDGTTYKRYSQADKTKLSNAFIKGTDTADNIVDGVTNKVYTSAEKTKLSGIATGAQVNTSKVKASATDTTEGFLGDKLVAGTNVTITKNNSGDNETYTIASSGSGGSSSLLDPVADLTALKAINTTAFTTIKEIQVQTLGLYKFQPASTLTGDDVNVITPTTGSSAGRWILQGVGISGSDTTTGHSWSETGRLIKKVGDAILKINTSTSNKKIVCMGSSVMLGFGLATPATQSYPAMTLAELNTDESGWSLKNFSISGEISTSGNIRLLNEIQAENPSLVWLGYSPNNNSLSTQTTDTGCANAIYAFETGLDRITRNLEQNGIPFVISGLYPKGDYTPLAYKYLKQCNINLQLKYGLRYINFLGSLDDGTGKFKASLVQADLTHPNTTGVDVMYNCIPRQLFISNRYSTLKDTPAFSLGNGIILGADTTTATPIIISGIVRNRGFTIQVDVYHDSNLTSNKVLMSINQSAKYINVVKNASGYIDLLYNDVSTLTVASTTKFKNGFNVIQVTYDSTSGLFELWLNGIKVGTSAVLTSFYFSYFSIGGSSTPANNATGVEFRNVAKWANKMTDDELIMLANGVMLAGSLEYFNSLASAPNGYYANDGGGTVKAKMTLTSTLWSKSTRGENTVTDLEKSKLVALNTVGTAVASAATITAPSTIFHVTGTVEISTINVPYAGFTGNINIIPDGVFTLSTSGNIAEAFTATVNRAVGLVYDGIKWYRV